MMTLLTAAGSGSAILTPEQVQALVIEPLLNQAVATQVSTVVQTASTSTRFPIVKQDRDTTWVQEGAEITPSDADLDELVCTPLKLAGLSIVSSELMEDSDPSALEVVGSGLVRDLQLRLDSAYFGTVTANGPNGLGHLTGVTNIDGGTITDLDAFAEALSEAEQVGALVQEIDACTKVRDLPALALRFTDVLSQIDDLPASQPRGAADVIAERRRQRRAQPS
jgi:HK97 family phage major capsid protein